MHNLDIWSNCVSFSLCSSESFRWNNWAIVSKSQPTHPCFITVMTYLSISVLSVTSFNSSLAVFLWYCFCWKLKKLYCFSVYVQNVGRNCFEWTVWNANYLSNLPYSDLVICTISPHFYQWLMCLGCSTLARFILMTPWKCVNTWLLHSIFAKSLLHNSVNFTTVHSIFNANSLFR